MSRPEIEEPTLNEYGDEVHPAFGMASVSRVTGSAVLFDSEIRHQQYVILRVDRASRKRDLNRDWVHSSHTGDVVEIAMSEAQWASLVSSVNTTGVPVTILRTEKQARVPGLPFAPRLEKSMEEVRTAALRAFEEIKRARDAYGEKKTAANLRTLYHTIENADANIAYAARTLTEHAENVVQKARADIESMVVAHAERLGIEPPEMGRLELESGED